MALIITRVFVALLGLFLCYQLIVTSAISGFSRLMQTGAILSSSLEQADAAIRLTPNDPQAHYTRALTLVNQDRVNEALAELQQATALRPHHYYEWLDLGVTRDRLGDQAGAAAALTQSIRLAPSFAQPHWQLGNLLYRQGRYEEAFDELRGGVRSNPDLFAGMLDLAWAAADDDVVAFETLVRPQTSLNRLEMANVLAVHGKGAAAAREINIAGPARSDLERAAMTRALATLLSTNQFADAYNAWSVTHAAPASPYNVVLNSNFLEPVIKDDIGFGWQLVTIPGVTISIDPSGPDSNSRSLVLSYEGDSEIMAIVYQRLLLQAGRRYSLSFMARTEKLVSGGPPVVLILDATGKSSAPLGLSKLISAETSGWTEYRIDFMTDEKTSAAVICLQRAPCAQKPCPIFGKLWVSKFSLTGGGAVASR